MKYFDDETIVFHNGSFIKAKDAKTGLYTQSLHYGNGIFDAVRAYDTPLGPHVFKAKEHFTRFVESAERMLIPLDYTVDELINITYKILEDNNYTDAYVRPFLYTGANMDLSPSRDVNLFIGAWKWEKFLGKDLLDVMTSTYKRPDPSSSYVEAKVSGYYANAVVALADAKKKGYDDALLLDVEGNLAEGTGANVFFEKDGKLYTPERGHIFPGITRQTVMDICKSLGIDVIEGKYKPEDMKDLDGAFFTGTAAQITGIRSIDGVKMKKEWEDSIGSTVFEKYGQLVTQTEYGTYSII